MRDYRKKIQIIILLLPDQYIDKNMLFSNVYRSKKNATINILRTPRRTARVPSLQWYKYKFGIRDIEGVEKIRPF